MAKDDKTNKETEVPAEEPVVEEKPKRSRKKAEPVAEKTSEPEAPVGDAPEAAEEPVEAGA